MARIQETPSAAALAPSTRKDAVAPAVVGLVVAGTLAALVGAAWFRSRRDEAALHERTAERLRVQLR